MQQLAGSTPSLRLTDHGRGDSEALWPIQRAVSIGRERADITLALPNVSRLHALVSADTGRICIKDLKSKNSTAVNGTHLADDPYWLRHSDIITVAGVVELQFFDPNATPVAPRLDDPAGSAPCVIKKHLHSRSLPAAGGTHVGTIR